MTFEEFTTALGDGTLKLDDVKAHLATLVTAHVEETPAPVTEDPAITALKTEMAALKAQVKAFGEAPAAQKATPGLPETDLPAADGKEVSEALKSFNEGILNAASAETNPFGRKGA